MDNYKWGMKIHWGKTNGDLQMVSRNEGDCKVTIDRQEIAVVEKLKYLGVMFHNDSDTSAPVQSPSSVNG